MQHRTITVRFYPDELRQIEAIAGELKLNWHTSIRYVASTWRRSQVGDRTTENSKEKSLGPAVGSS